MAGVTHLRGVLVGRTVALVVAIAVIFPGSASAGHLPVGPPAELLGASSDGRTVAFKTRESLKTGDRGRATDFYIRRGSQTTLISKPEIEHEKAAGSFMAFAGISPDGSRVFFSTARRLVEADVDENVDLYRWANGGLDLLTRGSIEVPKRNDYIETPTWLPLDAGVGTEYRGGYWIVPPDPDAPFVFATSDRLVSADDDGARDVYAWTDEDIDLLSVSATGENRSEPATLISASADHSIVLIETESSLVATDTDGVKDVYRLTETGPELVGGSSLSDEVFAYGLSSDGEVFVFETIASLDSADQNGKRDIYRWEDGAAELVTTGSHTRDTGGFRGLTPDAQYTFFESAEHLTGAEPSGRSYGEIYAWEPSGEITWITTRSFESNVGASPGFLGAAPDGSKVLFASYEPLDPSDQDTFDSDLYLWEEGELSLVTPNVKHDVWYAGAIAPELDRIVLDSTKQIRPGESKRSGIYEWADGEIRRFKFLQVPDRTHGDLWYRPQYSREGKVLFVNVMLPLVPADNDFDYDVYRLSDAGAKLISQ